MPLTTADHVTGLIGNTPVVKINSLSRLTGCDIMVKCEHLNPGGSVKDRAALQMIRDAIEKGELTKDKTIVEGTAGNTGIGLALSGKSLGFNVLVVMPSGQAAEKERQVSMYGADLKLVKPCPFSNPAHFYHTARQIAVDEPDRYWWANQFENLSNFTAHYTGTGPEIVSQTGGHLDFFVSAAGTGGTIGGVSRALKEKIDGVQVVLVDPEGSGLRHYVKTGTFSNNGSSITEGIGIMRLVENFKQAQVDDAFTLPDQDLVTVAHYLRQQDGLLIGSSSALNIAGALRTAVRHGPGKRILTLICDGGERSYSKLYNPDFLKEKELDPTNIDIDALIRTYRKAD